MARRTRKKGRVIHVPYQEEMIELPAQDWSQSDPPLSAGATRSWGSGGFRLGDDYARSYTTVSFYYHAEPGKKPYIRKVIETTGMNPSTSYVHLDNLTSGEPWHYAGRTYPQPRWESKYTFSKNNPLRIEAPLHPRERVPGHGHRRGGMATSRQLDLLARLTGYKAKDFQPYLSLEEASKMIALLKRGQHHPHPVRSRRKEEARAILAKAGFGLLKNNPGDYSKMPDDDLIDIYAGEIKGDSKKALAELKKQGWTEEALDKMLSKKAQEEYEQSEDWYYDVGRHLDNPRSRKNAKGARGEKGPTWRLLPKGRGIWPSGQYVEFTIPGVGDRSVFVDREPTDPTGRSGPNVEPWWNQGGMHDSDEDPQWMVWIKTIRNGTFLWEVSVLSPNGKWKSWKGKGTMARKNAKGARGEKRPTWRLLPNWMSHGTNWYWEPLGRKQGEYREGAFAGERALPGKEPGLWHRLTVTRNSGDGKWRAEHIVFWGHKFHPGGKKIGSYASLSKAANAAEKYWKDLGEGKKNPRSRKNAKGARGSVVRFMERGGEQERAISRREHETHDFERIEEMPKSPKAVREFEKKKKTRKGKRRYVRNNPIEYLTADEYMKGLDAGLFEEDDPRIRPIKKRKIQRRPKEAYWDGFEDAKSAWHKGHHTYSDIARWMLKNAKSGSLMKERSTYGDEYRRGAEEYFDARQDAESRRTGYESSDYWERGLNNPSGKRGTGPRGGYTPAERAALPASDFLVPRRRKWPVSNKEHANTALQYMTRWKGLEASELIRNLAKKWPVDQNPELWKRYNRLKPKIEKQCGCKVPSLSELKGGRRNPRRNPNPGAAEAMRLHHEEGIPLKEAWRRVKGGARRNDTTRLRRRHHWYY